MDDSTTIEVPRDFLEKLKEYEGYNNFDRLKNWAESYENDTDFLTKEEIEDLIEEKIEEAKYQNY